MLRILQLIEKNYYKRRSKKNIKGCSGAEAFTTKRGDILKLQSVKWIGNKMYMSFKKGNKVGWQIVNKHNSTSRDWFYGVGSRLAG